ncbi:MAG: endolytic transglycosylase MltG [Candidatus Pacebacteria bacterium]|nr:endolytic transglycosylase MltG [Candidatus Paceibacterota bacterium]
MATILFVIILLGIFFQFAIIAPQDFQNDTLVVISQGQTLKEISIQLEKEKIVSSDKIFSRIIVLLGSEGSVQAGSYYFKEPENAFSVAKRLISGDKRLDSLRITIPEGVTLATMAGLFEQKFEQFNREEFMRLTEGKEGYLFPDTYFFFPDVKTIEIVERLEDAFREKTVELAKRVEESGRDFQEIITMASIVEAEAYDLEDRKLIAGVLWNRLEINMPLQVDVTFRYINGKGTFDLTLDDLNLDSPYNTYKYTGLPPTPISNPGLESIEATIDYTPNDYLYFLADDSGNIHYSETFEGHKQKKSIYIDSR